MLVSGKVAQAAAENSMCGRTSVLYSSRLRWSDNPFRPFIKRLILENAFRALLAA